MNILPLVLSFLLVLFYSSYSLLKERQATHFESRSYEGHMETIREARSTAEEDLYQGWTHATTDQKKEEPETQIQSTEKRTPAEIAAYEKSRALRRTCAYSKFNLGPLKETSEEKLHAMALKLLETLYGHTSFFEEVKSIDILKHIIENTKGDFISLIEEISPHLETLYKMVKGTNTYNLENKEGYPPLSDFFSFKPSTKTLIRFHFTSRPILESLFGSDVTEAIYAKEKEKWLKRDPAPYLTEEELTTLINEAYTTENPLSFLTERINYKTKAPKKTTLPVVDKTTKIRLNQEVFEWELPQ